MDAASQNGRANRLDGATESSRAIPLDQQIPADQRAVDVDDQRRLDRGFVGRPASSLTPHGFASDALKEMATADSIAATNRSPRDHPQRQ